MGNGSRYPRCSKTGGVRGLKWGVKTATGTREGCMGKKRTDTTRAYDRRKGTESHVNSETAMKKRGHCGALDAFESTKKKKGETQTFTTRAGRGQPSKEIVERKRRERYWVASQTQRAVGMKSLINPGNVMKKGECRTPQTQKEEGVGGNMQVSVERSDSKVRKGGAGQKGDETPGVVRIAFE